MAVGRSTREFSEASIEKQLKVLETKQKASCTCEKLTKVRKEKSYSFKQKVHKIKLANQSEYGWQTVEEYELERRSHKGQ